MRSVAMVLVLVVLAGGLTAAPAPRPKAAKKAEARKANGFCGVWKATWAGTPGEMEFREDGWYQHRIGQGRFTGRWRWDENGWLSVEERGGEEPPPAGAGMRWKTSLLHDGAGLKGSYEGDFGQGQVTLQPGGPGA